MTKITFIDYQGNPTTVTAEIGQSVMEAATQNDVAGIDADCGGACACATCHVYVHADWQTVVGKPEQLEEEMLEVAEGVEDNSRLSCQMKIDECYDGLLVSTPESQF